MATRRVKIRVEAEDDTARGLRRVERRLRRLGQVGRIAVGNLISNAVTGAFQTLSRAVSGLFEQFDRIAKLGKVLEIDAATVRRFGLLAELSGTSAENVARLVRRLREVAAEDDTDAAKALETLGINLQEFQKLDAPGVILEYIQALNALRSANDRTALSAEAVGSRLSETSLLLAANQEEVSRQLRRSINRDLNETASEFERFNDNIARIGQESSNTLAEVVGNALQPINEILEANFTEGIVNKYKEAIREIEGEAKEVAEGVNQTVRELLAEGPPREGIIALRQFGEVRDKQLEEQAEKEKELADARNENYKKALELQKQLADDTLAVLERIANTQRELSGSAGVFGQDQVQLVQRSPVANAARAAVTSITERRQLEELRKILDAIERQDNVARLQ